ncbi:14-3-3 protein [Trichomonas vaginalis G3]|uniref:14-3-3 protein n=1 Tax=Trichomonas vaginalis (strain ATCC PRA-98 / G3) TaxID=412133 RepID=A2ERZ3_TRIV3|nr:protein domain specific binding [Trichomonas vaginalis G3]EAY04588.1 14-3-3 protein [Trichomonas vaginalis G3]KAI5516089.1 protein domain specific binding [Trichomonas vaginalis G3]|eukprot:XP_001316811.1 14-3-3 protein [Trichomonas vaginalis G3]
MNEESIAWKLAQVAMKAGQPNDAILYIKQALKTKTDLTKEEIDFFAHTYKKAINSPRNALVAMDNQLQLQSPDVLKAIEEHRAVLIEEITNICQDILNIIDSTLIPTTSNGKCIIYLNKLKGDYYRYLAEYASSKEIQEGHASRAKTCYEAALLSVNDEMVVSDPLNLGLILNYAVFQYEILNLHDDAIDKLDTAFNEAIRFLEELPEDQYNEAAIMLQLMRDNLSLWKEQRAEEIKIETSK